jgi:XTP/dITP diphosphohydrolase
MSLGPSSLLIATRNPGKLREVRSILQGLHLKLRSLSEFEHVDTVEESAATLAGNAARKAQGYALQTGLWSLADDSGLEVDALGGAPGVLSARFAGEGATDAERVSLLLSHLRSLPKEKRSGRFICVIAIADAQGNILHSANGICEGTIAFHPRGSMGFGYDSVFIPHGYNLTFAELESGVKNKISHRALALAAMSKFLFAFLRQS